MDQRRDLDRRRFDSLRLHDQVQRADLLDPATTVVTASDDPGAAVDGIRHRRVAEQLAEEPHRASIRQAFNRDDDCSLAGRWFYPGGVVPNARRGVSMGGMLTLSLPRAIAVAAALLITGAADTAAAGPIVYKPLFQDPGAVPGQDLSLENHAVSLINATPEGEKITFTLRDYNRQPISDALIAAHARGVEIDGVIDGGERNRTIVKDLQLALGADHFVICGSPTFTFNSCIANSLVPSLQHNKFLTFSKLSDERKDIVLQTSKNFFGPSQLSYYNDMVEIAGDGQLHDAYSEYVFDLKAQQRSDNHYFPTDGDDDRNTMFPSPRPQPDRDTDDTIVDRMDEIDCSEGGSASGKGLIRIANMAFRTERAVIMRKLVELKRQGCDIEVIVSNTDGDILSGLVSARIPVHPFFLRAITDVRPQVIVHSKFWLVDAKSTVTGARTKLAYVGSSNWRADQQYSDDMLLRIADDGVHARYSEYWELIRSRAASDQTRPATDVIKPFSAHAATPAPNGAGWNSSDVTVRVAGSDGHSPLASGLKRPPRRDVRRPVAAPGTSRARRTATTSRSSPSPPRARPPSRSTPRTPRATSSRQGRTSSASTRPRRRSPACRAAANCGRPTTRCATLPMCPLSTVSRAWTGSRCPARATTSATRATSPSRADRSTFERRRRPTAMRAPTSSAPRRRISPATRARARGRASSRTAWRDDARAPAGPTECSSGEPRSGAAGRP